jgi:tRNA-dihydrouridine synthase B
MLRLGPVTVDPPLFLAPMAGVTDRDFRLILRRIGGVGLVTMEFVSARGIVRGEPLARQIMVFSPEERPLAIQIYGSDPATMAEAARRVEASGAQVCDINMGCPANKVLRGCAGAALMGDLRLAEAIVAAVCRAVSLPVTVKFRLGLDEGRRNFLELGRMCQAQGAAAVALHPRTARQMFAGEADWEPIARLQEALAIPVVGNGDVATAEDALRMLRHTGCDGVMIGRAATRNPWIFRQIAARLAGGRLAEPSLAERCELVLEHFRTVAEREPEKLALHKLRLFARWYSQGLPDGARLRRQLSELREVRSFLAAAERFCSQILLAEAA